MNFLKVTGTLALFLSLGTLLPVYAQHEGKPEEKEARPAAPQNKPSPAPQRAPQAAPQPRPQQQAAQPQRPAPPQQRQEQAQPQQRAQKAQPQQAEPQQHAQQAQPQPRAQQAAPAQARQPQQAQQRPAQAQPQPQQRAQQPQQARQQPQQQPQRSQQQAQSWQQQRGWQKAGSPQGHATFSEDRSRNWATDHRTWAQRGGYGGFYIPQATFGVSFGSEHFFHIGLLPAMYEGFPRFAYGGYSFLMVVPWPEAWAANWYSSDDVYIDYNDGYYLYDRRYPGVGIAVTVVI